MLLPLIKLEQIEEVLAGHLPDYDFNARLYPLPGRSLRRYMFRNLIFTFPPAAILAVFFQPWGNLALVVPAAAALLAYARFKAAGWGIIGEQLSLRKRVLGRTTVYMQKNKIQSIDIKGSYFQTKKNLAKIEAITKSGSGIGGGAVQDIDIADANSIYKWFSRSTE